MARGWESKSVESQIEDRESRGSKPAEEQVSPAELERRQRLASLELARKRVLHDLDTNHSYKLEKLLRASLKHLDEKIAELQLVVLVALLILAASTLHAQPTPKWEVASIRRVTAAAEGPTAAEAAARAAAVRPGCRPEPCG